jgi:hypothetical protein
MATESVRIPDLGDLMFNSLDHPDPALAERAAKNVFVPIAFGIGAIGELMFSAASNKDYPPSMDTIANIGCLITQLAELSNRLEDYNGLAQFRKELAEALAQERTARGQPS